MTEHKLTERLKAHYEAGQTVVARTLGISVNYATIFPAALGNGAPAQTNSAALVAKEAPLDAYLAALANDAKVCLAGPFAHEKYRPRTNRKTPDAWVADVHRVQQIVVRSTLMRAGTLERNVTDASVTLDPATIDAVNHLMDQLKRETGALVTQYWPAIERVAQALLTSRVLYQDQIDALVRPGRSAAAGTHEHHHHGHDHERHDDHRHDQERHDDHRHRGQEEPQNQWRSAGRE